MAFFFFLREGGRKKERKGERKEPGELFKLLQRRDPEALFIKCYTVGDCFLTRLLLRFPRFLKVVIVHLLLRRSL